LINTWSDVLQNATGFVSLTRVFLILRFDPKARLAAAGVEAQAKECEPKE
jgi:hypothetical protein